MEPTTTERDTLVTVRICSDLQSQAFCKNAWHVIPMGISTRTRQKTSKLLCIDYANGMKCRSDDKCVFLHGSNGIAVKSLRKTWAAKQKAKKKKQKQEEKKKRKAEKQRQDAEKQRQDAEKQRQDAEKRRQDAERKRRQKAGIVNDSALVTQELPGSNCDSFIGKLGDVVSDIGVEIEFSLLCELHGGDGGNRF